MSANESTFENITYDIFDESELGYWQHELETRPETEELSYNTDRIIYEFVGIYFKTNCWSNKYVDQRKIMLKNLIGKIGVNVGDQIKATNVASARTGYDMSEDWVFGSKPLEVTGFYTGLVPSRWYDYPVGKVPPSNISDPSLWRNGLSLELINAQMYDKDEGFRELDICSVALNHGRPVLSKIIKPETSEFENPQQ